MGKFGITITQRLVAAFLLNGVFSLIAILFALASLHEENGHLERMVEGDFRAQNLARDLRENMLSQERLEKQYAILKDRALLDLLDRREREFDAHWQLLAGIDLDGDLSRVVAAVQAYDAIRHERLKGELYENVVGDGAANAVLDTSSGLSTARDAVVNELYDFWVKRNQVIDDGLQHLSTESSAAVRWTFFLLAIGMALGLPMAVSVVTSLHQSVRRLTRATEEVGAGGFNLQIDHEARDEFGTLARAFVVMGKKLREVEKRLLDANPLTHLPGNLAIEHAIEERIEAGTVFAHAYVDLDNFKVYNDRYGYQKGNDVIARVGEILREETAGSAGDEAMVGHIGGDDYVILLAPGSAEAVAQRVIAHFDRDAPSFYSEEDRRAGFVLAKDRYGVERKFSIMSISIAITFSDNFTLPTAAGLSREAARMKEHLKNQPGSNYLMDRRRGR